MFSRYSVKKPYTVIVGIILVIVLGVISFQKMTTDLLPSMNLPYVVVYTTYVGATPEQVEADVTRPMEASFATLTDVKKITSSSRDNVSVVIMQFNDGANMDTALIELSSRLDQLRGEWDDAIGAPVAMKLNPDMLPVAILSVTRDDMDILELSDYVENELVPSFEALNGVASATASGIIEQRIDVTIEQSRIDVLNRAILKDVDAELAEAEQELDDAQAKLSDGKRQLARAKEKAYRQIDDGLAALDQGSQQIQPAIDQLTQQRAQLAAQREQVASGIASLESMINMDPTQRALLQQMQQQLAELKQQLATAEQQLAEAQAAGTVNETLVAQRAEIQAQRDALAAERAAQQQYLNELAALNADVLNAQIAQLQASIAQREAALAEAQAAFALTDDQRAQLQQQIDALAARIAEAESALNPQPPVEQSVVEPVPEQPVEQPVVEPIPEQPVEQPVVEPVPEQPIVEPVPEQPVEQPVVEPVPEQPVVEPVPEQPVVEPVPEQPVVEPVPEQPVVEPVPEQPVEQPVVEPVPEQPVEQPVVEPVPEQPVVEPVPEQPVEQPVVEPVPEQPVVEPVPEQPVEQPVVEPVPEQPVVEPVPEQPVEQPVVEPVPEQPVEQPVVEPIPEQPAVEAVPEQPLEPIPDPSAEQAIVDPAISGTDPAYVDPTAAGGEFPPTEEIIVFGLPAFTPLRLTGALAEEASLDALRAQLAAAQESMAQLVASLEAQGQNVAALTEALNADRAALEAQMGALASLSGENADIQSRYEEAQRQIASLDARIAALDLELAGIDQLAAQGPSGAEGLRQGIDQLNAQIAAIENSEQYQALALLNDPEGMNAQYAQAQAGLAQIDAGIAQIDATLDKLNRGIIPGGYIEGIDEDTSLSDAKSKLESARSQARRAFSDASSQLASGEEELSKARKEFNEKRDEALENAGLDGVITVEMVSGIIGAQNFSMPAGYVYDVDNNQVLVRVGDKFDSLDALRRMKLLELGLDSVDEVRLLDVASVEIADNRSEVFTKLDGSDGILLSLDKQSTYSTADVAETILERAKALTEANPELHIVDLMNQGEYISIIVDSVLNNLLSGGGLAILILLLFLMDFRPTITVAFSIPISVVIAFVCMYFTGITLNVLSLSGLSLGIGMLVDNSIVAIENIYRLHDEEGVPLLRACVEGVRTVSGALFSSTLTTICVFLPIVFVQGMARDLFSDMGLTIAYSLLASLFVAMTVVPAMCSFLMRRSKPHKHRIFGAIQRGYTALLGGALRVKPLVLLAALALLVLSGMQVPRMGVSFMPEVNSRQMSAELAFAPEMTQAQQRDQAVAIMDDMMKTPGVGSVGLMGGGGGMLSGLTGGSGMSYYIIVDEDAGRKNADIAADLSAIGLRHDADLSVSASTMDISMLTGSGISVEITGEDIDTLQSIVLDVAELARQTEGVTDVDDGLEDAVPEMRILVDKEKAIEKGLTTAQVYQFIAQKVMGRVEISQVTLDGKEFSIYLQDGANRELKPEDLEDQEIEVKGKEEDEMVRIGDIASVREANALSTINRASQRRMVTVSFAIADGYSANLVSDAFEEKLDAYDVPAGYSASLAGENETVMAIMQDLVWMVLIAILLIFLIMVAQFQSFKSPIIVLFTIPLAFTGGLLALILTGMDLSIVSMLGFLVLSGVVVNNGIVFIDCVNQLRIGGMEKREALLETGRMRLRPILMTALTTILGMSTMALGQGTGAEMMQPMAVVSIGGLSYATLMTLFVVPVLYDLLNGKTMKAREIQMIKEAAGMTGDEVLDGDDRSATDAPTAALPAEAGAETPDAGAEAASPIPAVAALSPVETPAEVPDAGAEAASPIPAEAAPSPVETPAEAPDAGAEAASPIPAEAAPSPVETPVEAPDAAGEALEAKAPATPPALSPDSFRYTPPARPVRIRLGKRG